jgi:hypothetical protein
MARGKRISPELLEAALVGLKQRLTEVDQNITEVRKLLRSPGATSGAPAEPAGGRKRRRMSEAAKRRIARAQKRRWAAFRAEQANRKKPRRRAAKASSAPKSEGQ